MAQVTETVARGILAGHGYTDNEVRQLAHHWLASHGQAPSGATEEVENLRKALVYAAFALHGTPQYMLAQGITLIDGDTVRVSRDGWTVEASVNPHRQPAPATQQGVAYAALPDEGEPWRGHKFKEVQRGCWRCDCGKTIKEVTSDQSTPASGGNYPVMPKRYTVDDDGEELFTAEKMRAFADATHTLRASHGQAPAQPDPAYSAACNLATALFKKHFAHLPDYASGQVVWGLCDSTAGVISQIDNMVSGLVQPPTTSPQVDNKKKDPL